MPSEPRTRQQLYHAEAVAPATAVRVLVAAIVTIYAVQIGLVSAGVLELVSAVVADVLVLVGLVVYARRAGLAPAHFGLKRAAGVFIVAGVLIGVSAWYVNLYIVVLVEPPGDATGLQTIVEQTPLVTTILAIAVLPAIVEELVFRGVLARALTMRFVPGAAIALSAAAFGVFHLLPAQMLSTFLLGLILAYVTLRADSVVPAMLVHLLNNVMAIVFGRNELPLATEWMTAYPGITLATAMALTVGGITLVARGARE